MAARDLAAISSTGVQVGERNNKVSDTIALHKSPAIFGSISTLFSRYIW